MEEKINSQQVYKPSDVQNFLRIGRSKTYDFLAKVYLEGKPFRVLKVGNQYRILKSSFDDWLCGTE